MLFLGGKKATQSVCNGLRIKDTFLIQIHDFLYAKYVNVLCFSLISAWNLKQQQCFGKSSLLPCMQGMDFIPTMTSSGTEAILFSDGFCASLSIPKESNQ